MAPKEYLERYPPQRIELREHLAGYYAMVTHLDAEIGRVLKALEESGRADDTIVVFTADNGLAVGQHGLLGKQNLYDHSVLVPLVIRSPGIPAGERAGSFCYLLDLFPTLCDLTGVPAPDSVEGRSLVPALKRANAAVRDSVFLAYRHLQRGVRTSRWKLLLYNVGGQLTKQLFDVKEDPWELRNLAGESAHARRVLTVVPRRALPVATSSRPP